MTHPGPELTEYVDGTLPASRTARIDEHLRTCATCRAEVRLAIAAREDGTPGSRRDGRCRRKADARRDRLSGAVLC